jgi:hypothetical protein
VTVEIHIPRMQWLLPVIAKPAAPLAEGEEAAGAEEGSGGGGGDADESLGAQGAEASKQRKMELMKTSIDVKYVSGWAAFVQKMTDLIFFYNTGAYEHSTLLHVAAGVPSLLALLLQKKKVHNTADSIFVCSTGAYEHITSLHVAGVPTLLALLVQKYKY